jgi:hypothetical protein
VGHGFTTGQTVTIAGVTPIGYNGTYTITVLDADTFTYEMAADPGSGGSGTMTARNSVTIVGETPDSNAEAWQRVYNILPNADNARYANNLMLVPTAYEPSSVDDYATFNGGEYRKKDFLVAMDYLDEVHFQFFNEFRINQGSDDEIVDLAKFNENTWIVWKEKSWGVLSGVSGDFANIALDFREGEYGLAALGAWAASGKQLYFYARGRGIVSIEQSEQGKLAGVDVPLSAPIERTISRINGNLSSLVRMTSWENKLYCAVALDDGTVAQNYDVPVNTTFDDNGRVDVAVTPGVEYEWTPGTATVLFYNGDAGFLTEAGSFTAIGDTITLGGEATTAAVSTLRALVDLINVNNAVLVYDFVNAQRVKAPLDESARLGWTPLDQGPAHCVVDWFKLNLDGKERLFFAAADGFVNLCEEADNGDQVADGTAEQGLSYAEISDRKLSRAFFSAVDGMQMPNAGSVVLQTLNPKYSVALIFSGVGKSTTLCADVERDRTRVTRPWNAPRHDVTNVNGDHGDPYREDYHVTAPFYCGDGVDLGLYQELIQNFRIAGRSGRWFQLEVTNTQGRCRLVGISVGAMVAPHGQRKGKHI